MFWVFAGAMVAYQTDFVRVLMEDDRVSRRVFFFFALRVLLGIESY